jgi:hypothetical protein
MSNNKLSIEINCFEGTEFLLFQLKIFRKNCDFILLNCQEYSYQGNEIAEEDRENILKVKNEGLVDKINWFKIERFAIDIPSAKNLEKEKRNQGRNICKETMNSFYLNLDVDEFYKEEEFIFAKDYIIKNNLDYSYCSYVNYYNKPIYKSKNISGLVPFIQKINDFSTLGSDTIFYKTDPTRGNYIDINNKITYKYHLFNKEDILMHHFTGIRKNLFEKYSQGTLASIDRNKINLMINEINNINENNLILYNDFVMDKNFEVVDNYFDLTI